MDATLPTSFNVIECHSLSSLTVTILSCWLQLPLLDLSLSLSLSLPVPMDEPVPIDAKEEEEIAPSGNKEQKGQNTHTVYKFQRSQ